MSKTLRQQVVALRQTGMTYSDINRQLGQRISKSTLSSWLTKLKLNSSQQAKLDKNISKKLRYAQLRSTEIAREKRIVYLETILSENLKNVEHIGPTCQKLILSMLYLCEGAKYAGTNDLRFGSSDPKIIQIYLKLLSSCYMLDNSKMRVRIQCRHDQKPKLLEKYWNEIINIPNVRFYPTYIDKRTEGKPTLKPNYHGVCTIEYFNTKIQLELEILSYLIIDTLIGSKIEAPVFVSRWLRK